MTENDPYADLKQHRMTPEILATLAVVPRKIQKQRQHFVMSHGRGSNGLRVPATPPPTGWRCTFFIGTGEAANPSPYLTA
jgi:hypothetical protein